MKPFYLTAALTVLLSACALLPQSAAQTTLTADEGQSPTQTAPAPKVTEIALTPIGKPKPPEGIPVGAVIIYRRSGGIAGLDEQWEIFDDGRMVAKNGAVAQAAPAEVSALLAELARIGFFDLQPQPLPLDLCCDRFTYELTAVSGQRAQTYTAVDAQEGVPSAFWQALELVQAFLQAHSQ
jgi:hypothetical protein